MRSVTLIAKERNVPYKLITVDVKVGEQKQPAHLCWSSSHGTPFFGHVSDALV